MANSKSDASVVVVGSINVDLVVDVIRLPSAGETVLGHKFEQQNGGKSGNQAVAASRVGAAVTMLGAVGGDDLGKSALAGLATAGVDASLCRVIDGEHTGLALIVVDADGENQIAVAPGANARVDRAMIEEEAAGLRPSADSVCLLGYEIYDDAVLAGARWAAVQGLRIVLNPAPARPILDELAELGPVLTPNRSEAELLTGEADAAAAARALGARTGAPVVVTLGADGALLYADGDAEHLPATPVAPVDTTGAGDALNGIFAAELSRGGTLREALRWAMVGAAIKTTVAGAQAGLPTRETIARQVNT